MRRFLILLPLAACGPHKADRAILNQVEAQQRLDGAEEGRIACAKFGASALAPDCLVERTDSPNGLILTLRHPDGAFRRLLVTRDGRGVVAADGAQRAVVTVLGPDRIQVAVAGERYELPATVKARSGKQ